MRSERKSSVSRIVFFFFHPFPGKDDDTVKQLFGGKICRNSPKSWCERTDVFCTFSFPLNPLKLGPLDCYLRLGQLTKARRPTTSTSLFGCLCLGDELKSSDEGHTESYRHVVSVNLGLYHSIMEKLVPLLEKEKRDALALIKLSGAFL